MPLQKKDLIPRSLKTREEKAEEAQKHSFIHSGCVRDQEEEEEEDTILTERKERGIDEGK